MSFATYNRPWLEELRSQKERIVRSGALGKLKALLSEQHASKDPLLPIPLAFDRATFDALASAGRLILSAQSKLLRALSQQHSRSEMLRRFHIPESLESVVDWDELALGANVICRLDVVPSNEGYHFCEINTDSTVGGPEIADFLQVFSDALGWPLTQHMASPQDSNVALLRRVLQDKGLQRIVLCDWSANRNNGHLGFDLLRQHLVRALPELDIRLLDETEYPEAWLTPEEGRRTLVHRGFMYQDMTDDGAFMRRLCESGATVINKFETELRMHKGWLAILWDASYHPLLTRAEIEAIATYVPFTTVITRDNLDDLLARKGDLVFKLGIGYGGDGVWIGADHSAEHLRALIEGKGLSRWIAQQMIRFDGVEIPFDANFEFIPHNVVLGLYLIDGQASGLMVRASSSSKVVNVTNGAGGYTWAIPMTPEERAQHITTMRQNRP
ncbi:MAG: hypothetical protein H7138_09885 [Myxococcales bacterium]|nr:hypothetical protein [Myxococcales bacterium]